MDANVNAADLRRLKKEIDNASKTVEQAVGKLRSTLGHIHWQDAERTRFEAEFNQVLARTKTFVSEAQRFGPILEKKAQAIDQYRGH